MISQRFCYRNGNCKRNGLIHSGHRVVRSAATSCCGSLGGAMLLAWCVLLSADRVCGEVFDAVLYDGALQAATPDAYDPQWLNFAGVGVSQEYDDATDATLLDSTILPVSAMSGRGGYSNFDPSQTLVNPAFPRLNHEFGYAVGFSLQLLSESHSRSERAGFSLTAVSSDVGASIEIGFQDGRLFAHNADFGTDFVDVNDDLEFLGSGFVDYQLSMMASGFELTANGQSVLSGPLQDYSAYLQNDPLLPNVYAIPNFLFLGDNTSSAMAQVNLQRVTLTAAQVPEPASLLLFVVGAAGCWALRRRCRRVR